METRQQRLIREALEHGAKKTDDKGAPETTLRDKSLAHTRADYVPRTLTPHEWEAYYASHGVPDAHRSVDRRRLRTGDPPKSLRARLRRLFGAGDG